MIITSRQSEGNGPRTVLQDSLMDSRHKSEMLECQNSILSSSSSSYLWFLVDASTLHRCRLYEHSKQIFFLYIFTLPIVFCFPSLGECLWLGTTDGDDAACKIVVLYENVNKSVNVKPVLSCSVTKPTISSWIGSRMRLHGRKTRQDVHFHSVNKEWLV